MRHRAAAKAARARVLMLGDALEAVTTGSKVANLGGQFEQVSSIPEQADEFVSLMDGFRVLAIIDGNHERRVTRVVGRSPLKEVADRIARQQHHPCHYSAHGTFVTLRVGDITYRVVIHHGEGGPTTFFRYVMRDFPGANVYAGGHTHELSESEYFVHTPNDAPDRVRCIRTGSYLHLPSYAADRTSAHGIPATGSFLLWLRPDRFNIRLTRLEDRA